jgi:hypothetical protein
MVPVRFLERRGIIGGNLENETSAGEQIPRTKPLGEKFEERNFEASNE